jgi:tetratricopeptide (TPR) repeat protein
MSEAEDAQQQIERARAYLAAGRYGDAVAAFDDVVARFGHSSDQEVDWLVGDALLAKANGLLQIERDEMALAVYEEMAARYRDRPGFRGQLSRALVQQGTTLARLGRPEDALAVWDELLATFPDDRVPPLAMGVAFAYDGKAAALRALGRLGEALAVYDDLIVRFSDSDFPVLRRRVDAALSEKVFVLLLERRYDEAIVVANAAVDRLGQAGDADALAIAVLNLGGALAAEQRLDEAIDVYDILIDRLGDTDVPELRLRLIMAISNKVEALTALERGDDAEQLHREMLDGFGDEVPRAYEDAAARNGTGENAKPVVAGLLLKQAIALADLDHRQQALVVVENLIERFGDETGPLFEGVIGIARELRGQLADD